MGELLCQRYHRCFFVATPPYTAARSHAHPFDKGPASPFIGEIRDNGELQDADDRTVVPPGRRVLEGAPSSVGAHGRVLLSGQKEGAAP